MTAKGTLKSCKKGHHFYKSGDCTICPICEQERKPNDGFLFGIAAPARRALERQNIKTLDDLAKWSEQELSNLHGMGPNTLLKLRKVLSENGLAFQSEH